MLNQCMLSVFMANQAPSMYAAWDTFHSPLNCSMIITFITPSTTTSILKLYTSSKLGLQHSIHSQKFHVSTSVSWSPGFYGGLVLHMHCFQGDCCRQEGFRANIISLMIWWINSFRSRECNSEKTVTIQLPACYWWLPIFKGTEEGPWYWYEFV